MHDLVILPLLNFGGGSYDGLHDMLVDPMTVQGLGDGGAHVRIVCDASMTTYLLTHWTRDRTRGPKLTREWAVRRLTRDPAHLYGLHDRGVIAPGKRADPQRHRLRAPAPGVPRTGARPARGGRPSRAAVRGLRGDDGRG
jgi:N-acyl-D-aspartate/D-glutamate deacylase